MHFLWMSLDLIDDQSTLVQVIAWCCQATSHYLSQCWPRSLLPYGVTRPHWVNTLRPRENGRHFTDDIFKHIFFNENVWISIKFSLKFVPKGPINNIPALVQIMAWRRPGDKPLSEPMILISMTYICVTLPQWVKELLEPLGRTSQCWSTKQQNGCWCSKLGHQIISINNTDKIFIVT